MGLAERHVEDVAHQPVGEIGGSRSPRPAAARMRATWDHVAHHAGHGGKRERQRGERVHRPFLVLLHVLRIGERQSLHHRQQAVEEST